MKLSLFYRFISFFLLMTFSSPSWANCQANECQYNLLINEPGFYVAQLTMPVGLTSGFWGLTSNLANVQSLGGINAGTLFGGNEMGYVGFELTADSPLEIRIYEYTGKIPQFTLSITDPSQGNTVFGPTTVNNGQTLTVPTLPPAFYVAELTSPANSPKGQFGISILSDKISNNINLGGWLESTIGVGFVGLYLGESQTVDFISQFGNKYGNRGAAQPRLELYRQTSDGSQHLVFKDTPPQAIPPGKPLRAEVVAPLTVNLGNASFNNGKKLNFNVGVGSGAFHHPNDPSNVFYTISDRGPNIPCDETQDIFGMENYCVSEGQLDQSGKVFPIQSFTPSIYKFRVAAESHAEATLVERITLKDQDGTPITGLPNPFQVMDTEKAYNNTGQQVAFDANGVDTEALVKLNDGSFWLAEEYAPSLIRVAADGRIVQRVVPAGVEADLAGANYPVTGLLPAILQKRKLNRGIESIAISPDEQFLYFIVQSPLANPDADTYKNSRQVRLFKLQLQDGGIQSVIGEYVYYIDAPESFPLDGSTKQSDVKVSEMVALDTDKLIILERISKHTKLYRVTDLNAATNILNTPWDDLNTSPTLEQVTDLAAQGITPLTKTLAFDSQTDAPGLATKIEGIAVLDNEYVALINDNDFAIRGDLTEITIKKITQQLHGSSSPPPPSGNGLRTNILHFNDHHAHLEEENYDIPFNGVTTRTKIGGIAKMAAKINSLRNQTENPLVLHAGDAMNGTLYYTLFKGDADVQILNNMGIDAFALGNHEFDDGNENLAKFIDQAQFPVLAANIDFSQSPILNGKVQPYLIKDIQGQKVAIVGIDTLKTLYSSSPGKDLVFKDEVETARQMVTELEAQGINKIIFLTHYGYRRDQALATQVPGIDVIIGGDSHTLLGDFSAVGLVSQGPYPTQTTSPRGEPVCIAQAWHYSYILGHLQVDFDSNGVVQACQGQPTLLLDDTFLQKNAAGDRLPVDAATRSTIETFISSQPNLEIVTPDATIAGLLANYTTQVEEMSKETIGQATADLLHMRIPGTHESGVEMPNGSHIAPLVSEAFFHELDTNNYSPDLVIQNAGGVRIDIAQGQMTIGDAYTLLPFSNTLFILELTGAEVKQVLEDAVSNFMDKGGSSGSFPYAAKIRYTIDANQPINQRISGLEIQDENGQWQPIDPEKMYRIGTNSFIADGKDGYTTFGQVLENRGGVDTYFDYAQSFVNYVKAKGTLSPPESTGVTFIPQGENGGNQATINLRMLGRYESGIFDESAAEIVSYDPDLKWAFVVNAHQVAVEVLNLADPSNPQVINKIDASSLGGVANSVSVKNGIVAIAVENQDKQAPGQVVFYDAASLNLLNSVTVGALPDMVTFTPDGQQVLVACEGEPNDAYDNDPEGSIGIIDLSQGVGNASVNLVNFNAYDAQQETLMADGVRIFGPNATVSQDLEPEYIAVSEDSTTAFVSLQENNALAVVNVKGGTLQTILPLGFKDHSIAGNELDPSDKNGVNLVTAPVKGMYQPDSIAAYTANGQTYIVTANEGDARDYDGFSEEVRVEDVNLDPTAFPNAAELQQPTQLGRLKITNTLGDNDGDGDFEALYSYGARSFSIWDSQGQLVFDSGSQFESITSALLGEQFNVEDGRSDDKGPEPEALTIGKVNGKSLAFIGLERTNGIMVYDVTNPMQPQYLNYFRNETDIGPEGIIFIPAEDSPNGQSLLIVAHEVSGTTTVYQIEM